MGEVCQFTDSRVFFNGNNQPSPDLLETHPEVLEIFEEFINLTDIATCLTDLKTGELLMFNETCREKMSMYEKIEEMEGTSVYTFQVDFIPKDIRKRMAKETGLKRSYTWEVYLPQGDVWFRCISRGVHWLDGRVAVLTICEDVTKAKKEEERIHYLAYHDKRLGIPNGVKLFEDSQELTGVGNFYLCFNIQGLRKINNLYDRGMGNRLIKKILTWVNANKDNGQEIYRIENNDFVILFENCERGDVMRAAMRIYNRFERSWKLEFSNGLSQEIYVGIHMGVVEVGTPAQSYEAMQTTVEKVMSYARHENVLILFDEEVNSKLNERLKFEADLRFCILNGMEGFSLVYQSIVEAATGKWIGIEALCRWHRPLYGLVPSDKFIQEAERLGLISILTEWVLHESIRQVKEWGLDKRKDFTLDVNISPLQLRGRDLAITIDGVLSRYDFPAKKLRLEITESQEVKFDEPTIKQLEGIRQSGISLSLDDFGIGYASFSNLKNLPVDVIKTDRSFMQGLEEDHYLQDTIKVMVDFAQAADMKVVAEGVETASQCEILQEKGVHMVQGYYFSVPLKPDVMSERLEKFA